MKSLNEDSRNELIQKSRRGDDYKSDTSKGKNRYQRRTKSKVLNSVSKFNRIDMDKLFQKGILDLEVEVQGETGKYDVRISFSGFLQELAGYLPKNATEDDINLRIITRALANCLSSSNHDVFVHCNCKDFQYRFDYWSHINDTSSNESPDDPGNRPAKKTNPTDSLGGGCKHVLAVLSKNSWLMKVASVINNYINYMREHYPKLYQSIIYTAIFDKEYEEPQVDMFDGEDEMSKEADDIRNKFQNRKDLLDTSNKWAKTKGQFKKGNQSGIQFAPNNLDEPIDGQMKLDL